MTVAHLSFVMDPGERLYVHVELAPTEEQFKAIVAAIDAVPPELIQKHEDRVAFAIRIVRDALEQKAREG
jgi:peptide subunit release factor RF-3